MKKGRIVLLMMAMFYCNSCNYCAFFGGRELGENIVLLEGDKNEDRAIVYCTARSGGCCYAGIYIVPTDERHYNLKGGYTEYVESAQLIGGWVIVKTIKTKKSLAPNYWIIDNNIDIKGIDCDFTDCDSILQSYVIGPLTVHEFENKITELGIDVKW